jgi:hypothetical protein
MMEDQQNSPIEGQAGVIGQYNPVNVNDSLGVIVLGSLAIILLIALLRAQARNRKLLAELAQAAAKQDIPDV